MKKSVMGYDPVIILGWLAIILSLVMLFSVTRCNDCPLEIWFPVGFVLIAASVIVMRLGIGPPRPSLTIEELMTKKRKPAESQDDLVKENEIKKIIEDAPVNTDMSFEKEALLEHDIARALGDKPVVH